MENKQENIRDFMRKNTELMDRIEVIATDDLRIIAKDINENECRYESESSMEKNILEEVICQNNTLERILKILEETKMKLIG